MAGNNTAVVKVLADNADLTRKLAQSERKLKGFERAAQRANKNTKGTFGNLAANAQRAGGPVGTVGGKLDGAAASLSALKSPAGLAAAGVMGVAGAFAALSSATDFTLGLARATNKLKSQTGMNVEVSSAWISIAEGFGLTSKQLTGNLGFLSKRMKSATSGTKGAATSLAQFSEAGVSEATLRSGDMNKVLLEVAGTFEKMSGPKDGPKRAALAQQLFGKSGRDLLPILSQGKDGVKDLQGQMKEYGLTIDKKTSESTKKLGGSQRGLNFAFKGLKNTVGKELVPVFADFATVISKHSIPVLRFFRSVVRTTMSYFGSVVGVVTALVQGRWSDMFKHIRRLARTFFRIVSAGPRLFLGFLGTILGKITRLALRIGAGLARGVKSGAVSAKNWAVGQFNRIVTFISRVPGRLSSSVRRIASTLWGGIKRGASGVIGFVKRILNNIIGTIESGINRIIGGLNRGIRLLNRAPGPDMKEIGKVNFPRLAEGGIISRPTFAMVGEAGPEAVIPLSRNKRARGRAVAAAAGLGGTTNYFTINTTGGVDEQQLAAKIGWQLATRGLA